MPEENQDDKLEEEMLRMMQEETEGENAGAAGEEASGKEDDAEAEMLRAMQEEMGSETGGEGDDDAMEAEMVRAMMEETGASEGPAQTMKQGLEMLTGGKAAPASLERLLDVKLSVAIELGRTEEPISTVLEWTEGSLIELSKVSGEAVDVIINGKLYAKGEVVTIAENFGVRITELLPATRR